MKMSIEVGFLLITLIPFQLPTPYDFIPSITY